MLLKVDIVDNILILFFISIHLNSFLNAGVNTSSMDALRAVEPRNPSHANLEWIARKGQEGYTYVLCVVAIDSSKAYSSVRESGGQEGDGQLFCLNVDVQRCRYCAREHDALQTVAKAWHGAWSEVWSGNHLYQTVDSLLFDASPPLQTPALPGTTLDASNFFNPIQVGVIYAVDLQDDLWHIALRYGVDLTDILFWNPDLSDDEAKKQKVRGGDCQLSAYPHFVMCSFWSAEECKRKRKHVF